MMAGEILLGGETVYRVDAGGLDLFLAARTADGHGRPHSLGGRLGPGDTTPCLPGDDAFVYYARAIPGTKLTRLEGAALRAQLARGVPDGLAARQRLPAEDAAHAAGLARARARAERRLLSEANRHFARLFRRERITDLPDADDPVAAAARRTARFSGIDDLAVAEKRGDGASHDSAARLNRTADENRLRIHTCPLAGRWWEGDILPLLVLGRTDATAWSVRSVGGRTIAWNGATGAEFIVDAEFAAGLSSVGWHFVRPFPPGPVSWLSVVRCFLAGNERCLWHMLAFTILLSLSACVAPVVTSLVFSEVVPHADRSLLGQIALLAALFVALDCVLQRLHFQNIHRFRFAGCHALQLALFDRVLRLNVNFFRAYRPAELASRLTSCVNAVKQFGAAALKITANLILFIAPGAMIFYYAPTLAGVTMSLIVLHLVLAAILYVKILSRRGEIYAKSGYLTGVVERLLHGAEKIRAGGAATNVYNRWARGFADMQESYLGEAHWSLVLNVLNALLPISLFCVTAAVVVYGYFHEFKGGAIALSDFAGFTAAVSIVCGYATWILHNLEVVLRGLPSFRWVKPILEADEEPTALDASLTAEDFRGAVELDHVSFAYPGGRRILDDVSLRAEPGEFIALTGESGAGKSTALRLMLRFEEPDAGSVLYDGKDIAGVDMKSLRARFGVVMQTAATMPDTIFRNIVGYGEAHTEEEVWEAARLAGCDETIRAFPDRLQTQLADGTVSGGQRQRFLLAHAFLRKPRIFFLDEATSALDNATQKVVVDSLAQMKSTRIVIAHRLSTIRDADRIYYLDHGRIAEVGTFDELMAKDGLFARAARRQMLEEK